MKRMKNVKNHMELSLPSLSVNEGVARSAVAAFCAQMGPTVAELTDVKCALSEAVTNCIVHAYRHRPGTVYITVLLLKGGRLRLIVRDKGCGIKDVALAREPLYTTDAKGERSGMGFTVMESFMDRLTVRSRLGEGTVIVMEKQITGAEKEKE